MGAIARLFSFHGRTSRLNYWRIRLLATLILAVFWCAGLYLAISTGVGPLGALFLLGMAIAVLIDLAVVVRRLHDRNKSAWWLLAFYVFPVAGAAAIGNLEDAKGVMSLAAVGLALALAACAIWIIVELGFVRGCRGSNRFGLDPTLSGR